MMNPNLTPTNPAFQERLRRISGRNTNSPGAIDVGFPVQPFLDLSSSYPEAHVLHTVPSGFTTGTTVEWGRIGEEEFFEQVYKAVFVRFNSIGLGLGFTGSGTVSVNSYASYVVDNATSSQVFVALGGATDVPFGTGERNNVELLPYQKTIPPRIPVTMDDTSTQDSGIANLISIGIHTFRTSGTGSFQAVPVIELDLLF